RALTQRVLTRAGGSGLLRLVDRTKPDVIVSVFPQATEVLARLRRTGRLEIPVVAGFTDPAFYAPRSRVEARRTLGLPAEGSVVVVSGGGWGVGDVEGAMEEAL